MPAPGSPRARPRNPWWIPPFFGTVPVGIEQRHLGLLGFLALAILFADYDLSLLTSVLRYLREDFGLSEAERKRRLRFYSGMESDRTQRQLDRDKRFPYSILVFNVSDDSRMTTVEFFRLISQELFGEEKPFLHVPFSLLLPAASVLQRLARWTGTRPALERATLEYLSYARFWDTSKLAATGFKLLHPSAEEGLRETLRWYRKNGWFPV